MTEGDRDLQAMPPPIPLATHEIHGAGGVKLHAREWGNPDGPAILFIHGWSQSDICWLNQIQGDLGHSCRLVTYDLRGHGLSEKPSEPEQYTDSRRWADDVAAVIDQTMLAQPVIVAWSYGGYVVCDYLRAYGDSRIAAINLVGATTILKRTTFDHFGPGLLDNAQDMCIPDLLANIAATKAFLRACTATQLDDDDAATALAWNMVVPSAVRGALISRDVDGTSDLSSVSVPVLVTHGRRDMIVLASMAEHIVSVCPTATASWYDDAGHMPFAEFSDRFDRELAELVEGAASRERVATRATAR